MKNFWNVASLSPIFLSFILFSCGMESGSLQSTYKQESSAANNINSKESVSKNNEKAKIEPIGTSLEEGSIVREHVNPVNCKEIMKDDYIDPLTLPTWKTSIKNLVYNKCVPCHNQQFAAAGLILQTFDELEEHSLLASNRIEQGLLKPITYEEQVELLLWLKNDTPQSIFDLKKRDPTKCVVLP